MHSLQHISFASIRDVTDDNVITLIKAVGSGLRELNLSGCPLLTDDILISIRSLCHELCDIDLSYIVQLTKIGLIGLLLNSKDDKGIGALESVKLRDVKSVDDDVVIQIALKGANSLTHVDLSGCNEVTSKAITALKHHCCRSLQSLDISFIRKIEELILKDFIVHCQQLNELQMWGCSQVVIENLSFFTGQINC